MANKGLRKYNKFINGTIGNLIQYAINVNNDDANMHLNIPLIETIGKNPVSLSILYNHQYRNYSYSYGKGMVDNFLITTADYETSIDVNNADGTTDYYYYDEENNIFKCSNTENIITRRIELVDSDSDIIHHEMKDKYGNIMRFVDGSLEEIEYYNGNKLRFNGSIISNNIGTQIIKTTSGYTVTNLTYTQEGVGSSKSVSFEYDSNKRLIAINYYLGTNLTNRLIFEYTNTEMVIYDADCKHSVKFTFDGHKITKVEEKYTGNYKLVYELEYFNNQTKVTNRFGDWVVYVFDERELCVLEYTNKKVVVEYEYDNHKNLKKKTIPINIPSAMENNLLEIENYSEELTKSTNMRIDSTSITSKTLGDLGLCNIYKAEGYGSFKYRFECSGLALDNISLFMFEKCNNNNASNVNEDVNVIIRTYKNNVLMDEIEEYFSSIFTEEFDLLTLGLKANHSYDEIEFEVVLNGNISLYFTDICIMKKELGSLFSYDEYQNLTDMVSGSSQSAGKYNSNNLLEEVMDSEGNVVTYSYSRGNLETIKSQHSITCNNVYSDDNQITCQVIESETTYDRNEAVYDEYGNIIKSKDALNNITRYSYDSANFNRLCKIEGVKVILELEYNTKNRILSKMFKDIDNHNNNCKIKYVYEDDLIKNVYVDSVLKYTFVYNETKSIQEVYLAGTLIYKIDYNTDDEIEYVSYGNTTNKYRFFYDDHQLKYIYYVTAYGQSLKYEYVYKNNKVEYVLSYVDGATYKTKYTYNSDELIVGVTESKNNVEEVNVKFGYDNLNEINEEIINVKDYELIKTYDSISRSNGSHPLSFFKEYQNKDDILSVDYTKSTDLVGKNKEIKCINTKNSPAYIEPSLSSLVIPCMEISTNQIAAYKVNDIGSTYGSVAFWVKPQSLMSNDVLFYASARYSTTKAIKVYVTYQNKLKVVYINENGNPHDIIEIDNTIKSKQWNYFGMIWKGNKFYIMLNGLTKTGTCTVTPTLASSNLYYFLGHIEESLAEYNVLEGHYTGLVVGNNKPFDISFLKKHYFETKEYLIDIQIQDDDITYVNHTVTNDYQIDSDIRDNFDIYPLSNSIKSLSGNIPIDFEPRTYELDKDRAFNYNLDTKRYAYVADGNMLAYKFGNSSVATIAMRVYLDILSSKRYLFQAFDQENNSIELYVDSTGELKYKINSAEYSTGLALNIKMWHFVSFSYNHYSDEYSTYKDIRIYVNGTEVLQTVNNGVEFGELITVIGRKAKEEIVTVNGLTETTVYPLYGQIECLCVRNAYCELQTINRLYNNLIINTSASHYNELGMLKKKDIMYNDNEIISNSIYYDKVSSKENQLGIDKELIELNGGGRLTERNYTFENGNVKSIIDSKFGNKTYDYNYLGFLTNDNGTSITYDTNGNIQTYGNKTFTYDSQIKDRLASVAGQTITYSQAQPLYPERFGDKAYTFEGKRLVLITETPDNDTTIYHRYYYNNEGLRIKKVVEYEYNDDRDSRSETIQYFYSGNRLITEYKNSNDRLDFLYDNNGLLYGFIQNKTTTYYYVRDVLQNILGIVDSSGNLVVQYNCNAYGDNQTITGSNLSLGYRNPFRYKGYYYDVETGLFWCNSRYYNPEWGRWISPDSIEYLEPESINGLNLYAYCGNDPVNMIDPDGHAPKWWQSILIGVGVIAVAALAAAAIVYTGGGAAAFFVAAGQAALSGIKIAAVAGATAGIVRAGKTAIEGGDIGDVGKSLLLGFSDGFLAGSVYAAGSMLLGAASYRISGLINNGYGWTSGNFSGGYQTPRTPGISILTHSGGVHGGRSFGLDLDIYHGLHFHTNKFGFGKRSNWIKAHHWWFASIGIGIGIGLSDGWSEW